MAWRQALTSIVKDHFGEKTGLGCLGAVAPLNPMIREHLLDKGPLCAIDDRLM